MSEENPSQDILDQETEDDAAQNAGPRRRAGYIAALGICAALLAIFLWQRPNKNPQIATQINLAHNEYVLILGEMNTGVRLALLEDYLDTYPQSPYIDAAKAQYGALKVREEMAWARLSEYAYQPSAASLSQALTTYKNEWGIYSRSTQLRALQGGNAEAFEGLESSPAMTFAEPSSPFTNGQDGTVLAGARPVRSAPVRVVPTAPVVRGPVIVRARPKKNIEPRYPRRARDKGVSAIVTLSLRIDERGRVTSTTLVSVDAKRYKKDFVRAAKRAARRTKFHPRTSDGRAVKSAGFIHKYRFEVD